MDKQYNDKDTNTNSDTIIEIKIDDSPKVVEVHEQKNCTFEVGSSPKSSTSSGSDSVVPYSPTTILRELTNTKAENNVDIKEIAQRAVKLVLGEDNPYVCRLLIARLEGRKKNYKATSIREIISTPNYKDIKESLAMAINTTQQVAVDVLKEPNIFDEDGSPSLEPAKSQVISNWILKSLLHEKIKYREVRVSAQRWKYINGILMLVLPVITPIIAGVIQHYYIDPCDCGSH
jgi:hypothetical protein